MTRRHLFVLCLLCSLPVAACSDDTTPQKDMGGDQQQTDKGIDAGVDSSQPDMRANDGLTLPDIVRPDGPCSCDLSIVSINNNAQLPARVSSRDDTDSTTAGIQLDVLVAALCSPDGTDVELDVTGLSPRPTAKVANGFVIFRGVTVSTTSAVSSIRPTGSGCTTTAASFNVIADPVCTFVSPGQGATLTAKDDAIAGNGTFEYTLEVQTQNADGGTVTAHLAGATDPGATNVESNGAARWVNQILAVGANELTAIVEKDHGGGLVLSADCKDAAAATKLNFTVDTAAPPCAIRGFTPQEVSTPLGPGLGPQQDADSNLANDLQTTVEVGTDTTASISVTLDVDGQTFGPTVVTNGSATFPLTLTDGNPSLRATCTNTVTQNSATSATVKAVVDTAAPQPVSDLDCFVDQTSSNNRQGILTCSWSSASDGTSGSGVASYNLRCRQNEAIDAQNFDSATIGSAQIQPTPTPQQRSDVSGLSIPNSYSCALTATDILGNTSMISNVPGDATFAYRELPLVGEAQGDTFGFPVAAGDFNCDGTGDIAVGLFGANGNLGEVRLFFGTGSGFKSIADKRIVGTVAGGQFGVALLALDYNGDNCTDLAVRSRAGQSSVHLYLGRSIWPSDRQDFGDGTGPEIIFQLPSAVTTTLGAAFAASDLDGDTRTDLVISNVDAVGTAPTEFYVRYGTTNVPLMVTGGSPTVYEMPAAADVVVNNGDPLFPGFLGLQPVEGTGRLKGTQYGSFTFNARRETVQSGQGSGAVYVLFGGPRQTTGQETIDLKTSPRIHKIVGKVGSVEFGTWIGAANVNGSSAPSAPQLIVTDSKIPQAGGSKGEVYLFDLSGSTPPTSAAMADAVITNDLAGTVISEFGTRVVNGIAYNPLVGGDLDKDGTGDLLVAALDAGTQKLSSVFIFEGATGPLQNRVASSRQLVLRPLDAGGNQSFGGSSAFVGDINGDGFLDFAVSDAFYSSSTGRIIIYY